MDAGVKAAMLKSSHLVSDKIGPTPAMTVSGTSPRNTLRRVHSTESLGSLGSPRAPFMGDTVGTTHEPPRTAGLPSHVSAHQSPYGAARSIATHSRHTSGHWGGSGFFSKSQINLASFSTLDLSSGGKSNGKGSKDKQGSAKNLSPMKFCSILQGQSSLQIDIEDIKKLRLMLRNESAR
jgi:hypothetical protein